MKKQVINSMIILASIATKILLNNFINQVKENIKKVNKKTKMKQSQRMFLRKMNNEKNK